MVSLYTARCNMKEKYKQKQKFTVLTSSVCIIESRMLPMAVLAPTPTTTALALPATTIVPWSSKCAATWSTEAHFSMRCKSAVE